MTLLAIVTAHWTTRQMASCQECKEEAGAAVMCICCMRDYCWTCWIEHNGGESGPILAGDVWKR